MVEVVKPVARIRAFVLSCCRAARASRGCAVRRSGGQVVRSPSNLQLWVLQMKIRGILVALGQGQDLGLGIELPHKGDGAGGPVFGEAIGQHDTGMAGHVG